MEHSDAELVARLRAGDEAAFAAFVHRYNGRLLRFAKTLVPSHAVAEEVVQETWVAVLRGIHGFEGRSSVKTWLFQVLVNRARTIGRLERRSEPFDPGGPSVPPERFDRAGVWSDPPVVWSEAVEDRLVAEQAAARLRKHLDVLPDGQRQVLVLRDVEGMSAAEVAALLGVSDGNQRVLLHRARNRMRGILEREITGS